MLHDKKKKQKKKKNGVPERWLDYRPVGRRIPGTRFVAFKVPLKPSLNSRVPESDAFCFWDLLDSLGNQNQQLGLILDLTFTTRYYGLADVPQSCCYIKILTEGRQVPSDAAILSFKRAVRQFLKENRDNDKLIGVHCTHGLNRTGYLICRYLIDVDGLDAPAALQLFNSSRGHCIERQNYLSDLQRGAKRSNGGIDEPEVEAVGGLAVERPQKTAGERRAPGDDTQPETQPAHERPRPETQPAHERPRPETQPAHERPRPETQPAHERPRQETQPAHERPRPETQPAHERPRPETQPAHDRPPGDRCHHRARHNRRTGQTVCDRPQQSDPLPAPLLPTPPVNSYVWSRPPPPPALPTYSWSDEPSIRPATNLRDTD